MRTQLLRRYAFGTIADLIKTLGPLQEIALTTDTPEWHLPVCPRVVVKLAERRLKRDEPVEARGVPRFGARAIASLWRRLFNCPAKLPRCAAIATLRLFAEIDHSAKEPAGEHVATWRVTRLGHMSGPFVDDLDPEWYKKEIGLFTLLPDLIINFAMSDELLAFQIIELSGCVEQAICKLVADSSDLMEQVLSEVRTYEIARYIYDLCPPKGWRPRPGAAELT